VWIFDLQALHMKRFYPLGVFVFKMAISFGTAAGILDTYTVYAHAK
jgi:hypothetical protein